MNRKKEQVIGFCVTAVAGMLLHYVYGWSGGASAVGLVAPVNESVWEHLKLLVMPMLAFAVIEYFSYGSRVLNFWPVRLLSVLIGMGLIIVLYYAWSALAGGSGVAADIAIFLFSVWAAYFFGAGLLGSRAFSSQSARTLAAVGLAVLMAAFVVFSYNPPHLELFRDPQTNSYGPPR